jgi:hypothetical protein
MAADILIHLPFPTAELHHDKQKNDRITQAQPTQWLLRQSGQLGKKKTIKS